MKPAWGERSFQAMLDFARDAARVVPEVVFSVVDDGTLDLAACKALAEAHGAVFRVRILDETG